MLLGRPRLFHVSFGFVLGWGPHPHTASALFGGARCFSDAFVSPSASLTARQLFGGVRCFSDASPVTLRAQKAPTPRQLFGGARCFSAASPVTLRAQKAPPPCQPFGGARCFSAAPVVLDASDSSCSSDNGRILPVPRQLFLPSHGTSAPLQVVLDASDCSDASDNNRFFLPLRAPPPPL